MKKLLLLIPVIFTVACGEDALSFSAESAVYQLDIDWLVVGLLSGIVLGGLALLAGWKLLDFLSGGELRWRSKNSLEVDPDAEEVELNVEAADEAVAEKGECDKSDWRSKLTGNILPYILLGVIAVILLRTVDCA